MACMIPFDLSRLDSNVRLDGGDVKKPVMDRILEVGKVSYACIFISIIFSRGDNFCDFLYVSQAVCQAT